MSKDVWDKPNPKKKSKKLTPAQKAKATKSAKKHGRDTPSLVDNINAGKASKPRSKKSKQSKSKK